MRGTTAERLQLARERAARGEISRQRLWQIKMATEGRCGRCGKKVGECQHPERPSREHGGAGVHLSQAQFETLRFWYLYLAQHGRAPTFREICAARGASSTETAAGVVRVLCRRGYMSQSRHGAKRGLILHVVPIFDDTGIVDFTVPER
jgi:hypothetical protein